MQSVSHAPERQMQVASVVTDFPVRKERLRSHGLTLFVARDLWHEQVDDPKVAAAIAAARQQNGTPRNGIVLCPAGRLVEAAVDVDGEGKVVRAGGSPQCEGCSLESDHIDGLRPHFEHHDLPYVAVSRAPIEEKTKSFA